MTSPFNSDISLRFGFNAGNRALLGLLIKHLVHIKL